MRFSRSARNTIPVRLQMTAMIDVVFLLLTFFVMTFKIVAPEGDFDVRMPKSGSAVAPMIPTTEIVRVRLVADDAGNLSDIICGERSLGRDMRLLREMAKVFVGDGDAELAAEIDSDTNLRYQHAIAAIDALSGEVRDGRIKRLIEKVSLRSRE